LPGTIVTFDESTSQSAFPEREPSGLEVLRSVVQASPFPVIVVDAAGGIVAANEGSQRLFGRSEKEFCRATLLDLLEWRGVARFPRFPLENLDHLPAPGEGIEVTAIR